ncbi:MAG: ParB/RepB/Spo0J family partition protein [Candidatus Omnitrophica bacterium]|nr:ParB/RepB/Spo0J family partition protein [Candidatus Omnitrophota bacterium]
MKKALGRGLSSLIPDSYINENQESSSLGGTALSEKVVQGFELIPISDIAPNPDQPREGFSPEGIEELAMSIKEKGVLQPVIVKKRIASEGVETKRYELVCGERRLKAALLSGLEKIPAIVKEIAQSDLLEWALVENIQREDLNPLEEARAFERLMVERSLSQEEIAKRVGKNRTTITNSVRLLRLPEEVLGCVRDGRLTAGHARALLGLFTADQQVQLSRKIVKEGLSVRQVEDTVARSARKRRARMARRLSPEIADLEVRLARLFGTEVRIFTSKNSKQGRIVIHYFSLDELDRILSQVSLPPG